MENEYTEIAVVTDSTCDLGPGGEIAYGIDIVPLTVNFGDLSFRDGVDIDTADFYDRLTKVSVLPTTSQPSPAAFQTVFRRRLDEGKEIVGMFISAVLSGTYQAALNAKGYFTDSEQEHIHLIDSKTGSGALAILVLEACELRDKGVKALEIVRQVTALIPRVRLYAVVDTLKYLRMGGRLSDAAAIAGGILSVVPVITVEDGALIAAGKIRKGKSVFNKWLREKLNNKLPDIRYPAIYLHSNDPASVDSLREEFKYLLPPERSFRLSISAVIGTHVGPGAMGLVYVTRD